MFIEGRVEAHSILESFDNSTTEINALGEMAIREGSTIMDSVEIFNCS